MKLLITLSIVFCTQVLFDKLCAQDIQVKSFNHAGNEEWEILSDIAFDKQGNYYIVGSYSGNLEFQSYKFGNKGKRDIFVMKLDSNHEVIWIDSIGGPGDEHAYSVVCGKNDDVYIAGAFSQGFELNQDHTVDGLTDLFIVMYNSGGTRQLNKLISGSSKAGKSFLQCDNVGNIWLAGNYDKEINFSGNSDSTEQRSAVFAILYNSATLDVLSSFSTKNSSPLWINDFKIGTNNNLYFAGAFERNLDEITSKGRTDAFIAKYSPKGAIEWVRAAGGPYDDQIKSLSLDGQGNLFVAGDFKYEIFFQDEDTPINVLNKSNEVFIAKYSCCDGVLERKKVLGGKSCNYCSGISIDNKGEIYVSGTFRGDLNSSVSSQRKSKDVFIGRFDTYLNEEAIFHAGGLHEDQLLIDYSSEADKLFVTGFYSREFQLPQQNITEGNYKDIFFGNLVDCREFTIDLGLDKEVEPDEYVRLIGPADMQTYQWSEASEDTCRILYIAPGSIGDSTTFTLTVTDENGCIASDDVVVSLKKISAIVQKEEILEPLVYWVYPNPCDGKFYITFSNPEKVKQLIVFDLRGKPVKRFEQALHFPLEVDLSTQPEGIYIIKVSGTEEMKTFQVVVK
jgi:hypothetical protein